MNNTAFRGFFLSIAMITVGFAACNYTDGECWYYGEGTENAGAGVGVGPGGGVFIPTGPAGSGDYGDPPPKQPQDATNPEPPECNIVTLSPCHENCDKEDEARAIECAKIQDEAKRRACINSSYQKLKSCNEACQIANKKNCTEMFVMCQDKGMPCTRQIEWGKTLCEICRTNCQDKRPYRYSECYQCGFK